MIVDVPTIPPTDRRADDLRIGKLVADVKKLEEQMVENTEITKQVRDILGTFRVTMLVAKYVAAVGSAVAAAVAIWKGLRP